MASIISSTEMRRTENNIIYYMFMIMDAKHEMANTVSAEADTPRVWATRAVVNVSIIDCARTYDCCVFLRKALETIARVLLCVFNTNSCRI